MKAKTEKEKEVILNKIDDTEIEMINTRRKIRHLEKALKEAEANMLFLDFQLKQYKSELD